LLDIYFTRGKGKRKGGKKERGKRAPADRRSLVATFSSEKVEEGIGRGRIGTEGRRKEKKGTK